MAEIQERITAAKQAGYDDAAITQHLLTMPEYRGKVQTALDAGYKPNEILTYLSPPPASPGTEVLPGGAVVMAPAPSKFLRTPPPAGQVLQDVGLAGLAGAGFSAAAPQILGGAGALATGSGLAPLQPVGAALSAMGRGAQAVGPVARTATGLVGGLTSEAAGKAVEEQGGGPVAAEAARFAAGAVGPDVARLTGKLALRVLSSIIPGSHTERTASIIAKDIAQKLQSEMGRAPTVSEQQNIDNILLRLRGAPQSEWEKIAGVVGGEMERGAVAIRRAGESEINFARRKAESDAADLTTRATTSLAEANAKATQLQAEATRSLNAAEDAARAEIETAKKSGIPFARAATYNETLKQDVLQKAKATIAGVGNPAKEVTDIGNELRTVATAIDAGLRDAASTAYKKGANEVASNVAKLESAGIHVDSMPAYKQLVADLRSQLLPNKHTEEVAAVYRKILNQITGSESKQLGVLAQAQQELSGAVPAAAAPPSFQMIDEARRMLGEAFRGQPAEGYAALSEIAKKKYYQMLSKVQVDFAGAKQRQVLDDYATSRPDLAPYISRTGKKIVGIDLKDKEQFLTDPASIPSTFFKTPTQFNNLVNMVGSRDLAVKAARDYAANQLSAKQTSSEIGSWMTTNRDFLKSVPEVRDAVLQHKNNLAAAERTSGILDAGINKLRTQAEGLTSAAGTKATGIRTGGGVQFRELTTQAGETTKQAQQQATKIKAETDQLVKNANAEIGNISNRATAAADLVYSQHSAMRNVRDLIEKGDMTRWAAVAPIIERSPEAKRGVYDAVRQVAADMATSKGALQKFNETIRPPLERFGMLSAKEADNIAASMAEVSARRMPEQEKLTLMRRLMLQGVSGYSSSLSSRAAGFSLAPDIPGNALAPPPQNQNRLAPQ